VQRRRRVRRRLVRTRRSTARRRSRWSEAWPREAHTHTHTHCHVCQTPLACQPLPASLSLAATLCQPLLAACAAAHACRRRLRPPHPCQLSPSPCAPRHEPAARGLWRRRRGRRGRGRRRGSRGGGGTVRRQRVLRGAPLLPRADRGTHARRRRRRRRPGEQAHSLRDLARGRLLSPQPRSPASCPAAAGRRRARVWPLPPPRGVAGRRAGARARSCFRGARAGGRLGRLVAGGVCSHRLAVSRRCSRTTSRSAWCRPPRRRLQSRRRHQAECQRFPARRRCCLWCCSASRRCCCCSGSEGRRARRRCCRAST